MEKGSHKTDLFINLFDSGESCKTTLEPWALESLRNWEPGLTAWHMKLSRAFNSTGSVKTGGS